MKKLREFSAWGRIAGNESHCAGNGHPLFLLVTMVLLIGATVISLRAVEIGSGLSSFASGETKYQFSASGFKPMEKVNTWVGLANGRNLALAQAMADGGGKVSFTVVSGNSWVSGPVQVVARGVRSNHEASNTYQFSKPVVQVAANVSGRKVGAKCDAITGGMYTGFRVGRIDGEGPGGHCVDVKCTQACCNDACQCNGNCGASPQEVAARMAAEAAWRTSQQQTNSKVSQQGTPPGVVPNPNTAAGAGDIAWTNCVTKDCAGLEGDQCSARCTPKAKGAYDEQYAKEEKQIKQQYANDPAGLQKALQNHANQNTYDGIETAIKSAAACKDGSGVPLLNPATQCIDPGGEPVILTNSQLIAAMDKAYGSGCGKDQVCAVAKGKEAGILPMRQTKPTTTSKGSATTVAKTKTTTAITAQSGNCKGQTKECPASGMGQQVVIDEQGKKSFPNNASGLDQKQTTQNDNGVSGLANPYKVDNSKSVQEARLDAYEEQHGGGMIPTEMNKNVPSETITQQQEETGLRKLVMDALRSVEVVPPRAEVAPTQQSHTALDQRKNQFDQGVKQEQKQEEARRAAQQSQIEDYCGQKFSRSGAGGLSSVQVRKSQTKCTTDLKWEVNRGFDFDPVKGTTSYKVFAAEPRSNLSVIPEHARILDNYLKLQDYCESKLGGLASQTCILRGGKLIDKGYNFYTDEGDHKGYFYSPYEYDEEAKDGPTIDPISGVLVNAHSNLYDFNRETQRRSEALSKIQEYCQSHGGMLQDKCVSDMQKKVEEGYDFDSETGLIAGQELARRAAQYLLIKQYCAEAKLRDPRFKDENLCFKYHANTVNSYGVNVDIEGTKLSGYAWLSYIDPVVDKRRQEELKVVMSYCRGLGNKFDREECLKERVKLLEEGYTLDSKSGKMVYKPFWSAGTVFTDEQLRQYNQYHIAISFCDSIYSPTDQQHNFLKEGCLAESERLIRLGFNIDPVNGAIQPVKYPALDVPGPTISRSPNLWDRVIEWLNAFIKKEE